MLILRRSRPRQPVRTVAFIVGAVPSVIMVGAALSAPTNCQSGAAPTDGLAYMSDLSAFGDGVVAADDFVPLGDTISRITVWGVYLDPTGPGATGPVGTEQFDCTGMVTDHFRVRVFRDADGLPGQMVGQSEVTDGNVVRTIEPTASTLRLYGGFGIRASVFELTLDAPIDGLVPGGTYWLEVAGATFGPGSNTCEWHWLQHQPAGRPNDRDAYCATGVAPGGLPGNSLYIDGSERGGVDLAFCLWGPQGPLNFDPPQAIVAACWACGTPTAPPRCILKTLRECTRDRDVWNRLDRDCTGSFPAPSNDVCSDGPRPVSDGLHAFETACALHDGPYYDRVENAGRVAVVRDLWFEYRATTTGLLVASMCATQTGYTQDGFASLDGVVALFHDQSSPSECPCPGMTGFVNPVQLGLGGDDNCNGLQDGGSGVAKTVVFPGECITVSVAPWDCACAAIPSDHIGRGLLNIRTEPASCPLAAAPVPKELPTPGGQLVAAAANRFLAFQVVGPGIYRGVRVTFVDLPPPFEAWNGAKMWVGKPGRLSESPSMGFGDHIGIGSSIGVATLQCDPYFDDWSQFGPIHVFHEAIIPSRFSPRGIAQPAVYAVQVIDAAVCRIEADEHFSPPLTITNARWGDVAGPFLGGVFTASDNRVDVPIDVVAILDKFAGQPSAPSKFRVDLEPGMLDGKITVSDLVGALDAFRGLSYPFPPPPPPCP